MVYLSWSGRSCQKLYRTEHLLIQVAEFTALLLSDHHAELPIYSPILQQLNVNTDARNVVCPETRHERSCRTDKDRSQ